MGEQVPQGNRSMVRQPPEPGVLSEPAGHGRVEVQPSLPGQRDAQGADEALAGARRKHAGMSGHWYLRLDVRQAGRGGAAGSVPQDIGGSHAGKTVLLPDAVNLCLETRVAVSDRRGRTGGHDGSANDPQDGLHSANTSGGGVWIQFVISATRIKGSDNQ
jgi:hypothetical protein